MILLCLKEEEEKLVDHFMNSVTMTLQYSVILIISTKLKFESKPKMKLNYFKVIFDDFSYFNKLRFLCIFNLKQQQYEIIDNNEDKKQ